MPLDFSLTAEQEAIQQLAHEFAEKEIRPVAAYHDETEEFPYEVVKKAHRLGPAPAGFLPPGHARPPPPLPPPPPSCLASRRDNRGALPPLLLRGLRPRRARRQDSACSSH